MKKIWKCQSSIAQKLSNLIEHFFYVSFALYDIYVNFIYLILRL